jgi:hypothetical protein
MPEQGYRPTNKYLPPRVATYLPLGVFAIGWGVYGRRRFRDRARGNAGRGRQHRDGLLHGDDLSLAEAGASMGQSACRAGLPRARGDDRGADPDGAAAGLGPARPAVAAVAVVATALAVLLKERYWRFIDGTPAPSTIGSATGLGRLGEVRLFEPPHTGSNYLMKEMGFRVARKHALKLRRLALVIGFALPLLLSLCAALIAGPLGALAAVLAAVSALVGVLVERWLFFAEAKHTVTLYYGAATA